MWCASACDPCSSIDPCKSTLCVACSTDLPSFTYKDAGVCACCDSKARNPAARGVHMGVGLRSCMAPPAAPRRSSLPSGVQQSTNTLSLAFCRGRRRHQCAVVWICRFHQDAITDHARKSCGKASTARPTGRSAAAGPHAQTQRVIFRCVALPARLLTCSGKLCFQTSNILGGALQVTRVHVARCDRGHLAQMRVVALAHAQRAEGSMLQMLRKRLSAAAPIATQLQCCEGMLRSRLPWKRGSRTCRCLNRTFMLRCQPTWSWLHNGQVRLCVPSSHLIFNCCRACKSCGDKAMSGAP